MSTAPVITIFVRHAADCKYAGDEFSKRCRCRKHLRWSQNGKQHRRKANTRSWEEAEEVKRELTDQLSGKLPERTPEDAAKSLQDALDLFTKDRKAAGVTAGTLSRYKNEREARGDAERRRDVALQGMGAATQVRANGRRRRQAMTGHNPITPSISPVREIVVGVGDGKMATNSISIGVAAVQAEMR